MSLDIAITGRKW